MVLIAIAACAVPDAQAYDIPLFLRSSRTPPPPPERWQNVQGVLPDGTSGPKRDSVAESFTYETSTGSLKLVPGFSQALHDDEAVSLDQPVRYHDGDLFVHTKDADRLRKLFSSSKPACRPQKKQKKLVVVLDPGHGGRDPGAIDNGLQEKAINLQIARRLKKRLESKGFEVVMTRDSDVFLPLEDRPAVATRLGADLFVSIHANAEDSGAVTGVETFFCKGAARRPSERRALRRLCKQYGRDGATRDMTAAEKQVANEVMIESARAHRVRLARHIQRCLSDEAGTLSRGIKPGPWRVLRCARCPAVLVEVGFLTSRVEAARLQNPIHQEHIAKGIAEGIARYASTLSDGQSPEVSQQP
jgi:N-acetylmuramoyl-L-alanine amidase